MNFSLIFKKLRKENKLTQFDLSNRLAVSRSAIAQIESENNKPSKELVLRILEEFDPSEEIKLDLKTFLEESKNQFSPKTSSDLVKENDEEDCDKTLMWDTYGKLVDNMNNLMCLCISLKEYHNYNFSKEEISKLLRVQNAVSYLDNLTRGRIRFRLRLFQTIYVQLEESNKLINHFTIALLPYYRTTIRTVNDLLRDNIYEDEDLPID